MNIIGPGRSHIHSLTGALASAPARVAAEALPADGVSLSGTFGGPNLGRLVAVGGMVAGCVVAGVTLGPMGLLITAVGQALAFAGGLLMARSAQKQLEQTNQQLLHQATTDALTGLRNRAALFSILEDELESCRRQRCSLSVILSDLDHFKRINDTWGHPAGDAVLQEVARRVAAAVRAVDSAGRYGGEEMMVVLPGSTTADAAQVAERIRQGVGARPVLTFKGPIHVTVSLGVAGTDLADPANLVSAADEALYRAKNRGRNRVELSGADPGFFMASG